MTVLQTPQSLGGKDRSAAQYFDELNRKITSLESQLAALTGGEEEDVAALTTWSPLFKRGLITSRASATSITVGIGGCATTIGGERRNLTVTTPITKTLDTFVAGSGNGGLTSAIASDTWYHIFVGNNDAGVSDVFFDTNPTSPSLPSAVTRARRVGSFLTNGSSEVTAYLQNGNRFQWDTMVLDVNVSLTGTSPVTRVLSVPPGVVVLADILASVTVSAGGSDTFGLINAIASANVASGFNLWCDAIAATDTRSLHQISCDTDLNQSVRSRMDVSALTSGLQIYTFGWSDYFGETP